MKGAISEIMVMVASRPDITGIPDSPQPQMPSSVLTRTQMGNQPGVGDSTIALKMSMLVIFIAGHPF